MPKTTFSPAGKKGFIVRRLESASKNAAQPGLGKVVKEADKGPTSIAGVVLPVVLVVGAWVRSDPVDDEEEQVVVERELCTCMALLLALDDNGEDDEWKGMQEGLEGKQVDMGENEK